MTDLPNEEYHSRELEVYRKVIQIDSPEQRERFLDCECGGDAQLRTMVETLINIDVDSEKSLLIYSSIIREIVDVIGPEAKLDQENRLDSSEGNYEFGPELAHGGMGSVYEASDRKLNRSVAIKVMHSEMESHPSALARFVQEAEVLAILDHPNIVPIYDIVWENGKPNFYSMKLVRGRTLQAIVNDLSKETPGALEEYTLDRLLLIFRKVCDAMAFSHSRGIIHRDLKPENIMVGEFGEVLVMDWGLAKILRDDTPPSVEAGPGVFVSDNFAGTLQGDIMGTPQYMSPEQACGNIDDLDHRSDIFSLGGILYAILTLRPPVEGATVQELLDKVSRAEIASPSDLITTSGNASKGKKGAGLEGKETKPIPHVPAGKVPPALSAVAMKALTLAKEERYRKVADLSQDIEKWQSGFATSAEEAGFGRQLGLLIKRNKGIFTTGIAAWALITALAVWFVINLREKEKRAVAGAERATTAEALAVQEKETARAALAESSLLLADSALRENDLQSMLKALDAVPEDLRDATWKYLQDESDTSILQINDGYVQCVAAHPASPSVFAYAKPDKIKLLNVRSGEILLEFDTPIRATMIALSPDGKKIAVGTRVESGGLAIHRTSDGVLLKEWPAESSEYLEFNEDGSLLLQSVRPQKSSVQLWNAQTGNLLWKAEFGRSIYVKGRFVPGAGQILYTDASNERATAMFLSQQNGSVIQTCDWGKIRASAVNRDGSLVVTRNEKGRLMGYLRNDRKPAFELHQPGTDSFRLDFVQDHERFVQSLKVDKGIRPPVLELRDSATGEWRRSFTGIENAFETVATHPLTGEVVIGGHHAKVWEGETPATWKMRTSEFRFGVFWGGDDLFLGPVSPEMHALQRLSPGGGAEVVQSFGIVRYMTTTVSSDGRFALLTGSSGKDRLKLLKNPGPDPELVAACEGPKKFVTRNWLLGPKGERIVASARNSPPHILDARSGSVIVSLKRINDGAKTRQLAWICDGERVIGLTEFIDSRGFSRSEYQIVVWDAATGEIVKSFAHDTLMVALSISPDGSRFAEAGLGKRIRIRDTETLEVLQEFRAHNDDISQLAWHPTLPVVASASRDFTVKIWNLDTGELLQMLRTLDSRPTALSFSPTGKRITCSEERYTRIWDLISPEDPRLPSREAQDTPVNR